MIEEQICI